MPPTDCARKCTGWRAPRAQGIVMPVHGRGNAPGMTQSNGKIRLRVSQDGANMLATIRRRKYRGWQMNNLLRLLLNVGLAAGAIAIVALGLERHNVDLLAPLSLLLFVAGLLVYLLPTELAIYRDCKSTAWIVAVNLLLGWTIFGWFAAMGWAAGGKVHEAVHPMATPPVHPVPGH